MDAASGPDSSKQLANCVRCIAFLGTPHHGSDETRWAESAKVFLSYCRASNQQVTKELVEKSEKLAKLGVQFPNLLSSRAQKPEIKIEIVCFYESLPTKRGNTDLGIVCRLYIII